MDRILSYLGILVGLFLILFSQMVGAAIIMPTLDVILDTGSTTISATNQNSMHGMAITAVRWVPLLAGAGLVVIGIVREYRRQRTTVARVRR